MAKKPKKELTEKQKRAKRRARKRFFIKLLVVTGIGLILWFLIFTVIPQHGNQMFPVVKDGDLMITLKVKPKYQPQAVVAYKTPDGKKRIGRIIAMEGEKINLTEEGRLEVNDMIATEEIFYPTEKSKQNIELPYTVPSGSYFILNDHRTETDDSREYGAIKKKDMLGTAFLLMRRRSF